MRLIDMSHNAAVAALIAERANKGDVFDNYGSAWLHGLLVGVALTLRDPEKARELRAEMERMVGDARHTSPEQVEVSLRSLVDEFDLT